MSRRCQHGAMADQPAAPPNSRGHHHHLDEQHGERDRRRRRVAGRGLRLHPATGEPRRDQRRRHRAGHAARPEVLGPESRFGMKMSRGVPYRMTSKVVEFDENRVIAWCHFGGHRWRWELEPDGGGATKVTETFDGHDVAIADRAQADGAPEGARRQRRAGPSPTSRSTSPHERARRPASNDRRGSRRLRRVRLLRRQRVRVRHRLRRRARRAPRVRRRRSRPPSQRSRVGVEGPRDRADPRRRAERAHLGHGRARARASTRRRRPARPRPLRRASRSSPGSRAPRAWLATSRSAIEQLAPEPVSSSGCRSAADVDRAHRPPARSRPQAGPRRHHARCQPREGQGHRRLRARPADVPELRGAARPHDRVQPDAHGVVAAPRHPPQRGPARRRLLDVAIPTSRRPDGERHRDRCQLAPVGHPRRGRGAGPARPRHAVAVGRRRRRRGRVPPPGTPRAGSSTSTKPVTASRATCRSSWRRRWRRSRTSRRRAAW